MTRSPRPARRGGVRFRAVKVLVTTTPGLGHVLPILPLAQHLQARGHEVRWVVGPDGADAVRATGIAVTEGGLPARQRQAELGRQYPQMRTLPERERRLLGFSKGFGEIAAPVMLDVLWPLVAAWRPDVVVHDAADLAGPLVAAATGIPSACHGFGEVVPEPAVRRAGAEVAPLWEAAGLAADPYAGSYRGTYLDIYPPSLRSLDMGHVPRVQAVRPAEGRPAAGELAYVTFGTMFNVVDDCFRAAIRAAASTCAEVLVTVGPDGDPAAVGEQPANVRVERFVPQAEVLPRCRVVLCHGGSGTVLAALAHGVPLLCLPQGADQFANAANVAAAGCGIDIGPASVTEPALRAALAELVEAPAHLDAARAMAAEIAAMPGPSQAAAAVEALAAR